MYLKYMQNVKFYYIFVYERLVTGTVFNIQLRVNILPPLLPL